MAKDFLKKLIGRSGFQLKRVKRRAAGRKPPPVLFDDLHEALHYDRGGVAASFRCPLTHCVHRSGLNFSKGGWHPFVETLRECEDENRLTYEQSSLKKFFEKWQPASAHQAIAGFTDAPGLFRSLLPHLFYLSPWVSKSVEQVDKATRTWHKRDEEEHGKAHLDMERDGFVDFGPVSQEKGQLEFHRLTRYYRQIKKEGYQSSYGSPQVLVLRRDDEYRFVVSGDGYHRMAILTALGYDEVPATFYSPWFISLDDIAYWPQVRKGVWSRENAARYFHHLFDFDSKAWAREIGLVHPA